MILYVKYQPQQTLSPNEKDNFLNKRKFSLTRAIVLKTGMRNDSKMKLKQSSKNKRNKLGSESTGMLVPISELNCIEKHQPSSLQKPNAKMSQRSSLKMGCQSRRDSKPKVSSSSNLTLMQRQPISSKDESHVNLESKQTKSGINHFNSKIESLLIVKSENKTKTRSNNSAKNLNVSKNNNLTARRKTMMKSYK